MRRLISQSLRALSTARSSTRILEEGIAGARCVSELTASASSVGSSLQEHAAAAGEPVIATLRARQESASTASTSNWDTLDEDLKAAAARPAALGASSPTPLSEDVSWGKGGAVDVALEALAAVDLDLDEDEPEFGSREGDSQEAEMSEEERSLTKLIRACGNWRQVADLLKRTSLEFNSVHCRAVLHMMTKWEREEQQIRLFQDLEDWLIPCLDELDAWAFCDVVLRVARLEWPDSLELPYHLMTRSEELAEEFDATQIKATLRMLAMLGQEPSQKLLLKLPESERGQLLLGCSIVRCRSWGELSLVMSKEHHRLDQSHCFTALLKAGALGRRETNAPRGAAGGAREKAISLIERRASLHMHNFDGGALALLIDRLVKMPQQPLHRLLSKMAVNLRSKAAALDAKHVVLAIRGMRNMIPFTDGASIQAVGNRACAVLPDMTPKMLSRALGGLAVLRYVVRPQTWLDMLKRVAKEETESPRDFSATLHALSTIVVTPLQPGVPKKLLKQLAAKAEKHVNRFRYDEYARVVWGLARMGYKPEGTLEQQAMAAYLRERLPHTTAKGFCMSITALAMFDYWPNHQDLRAWMAKAREVSPELNPINVYYLMPALASFRVPLGDKSKSWRPLLDRVRELLPSLQPEQLVTVVWSLWAFQKAADDAFYAAMDAAVAAAAPNMGRGGLVKLWWGYAALKRMPSPDAHAALLASTQRSMKGFYPHHIEMLDSALTTLGIDPQELRPGQVKRQQSAQPGDDLSTSQ